MLANKTIKEFFEEGATRQERYSSQYGVPSPSSLTDVEAEKYVNEFLCHIIEEAIEARMLVPRKFWKKEPSYLSTPEGKKEFARELCDILLFLRSVVIYSKIPLDDILSHFEDKINYNEIRQDHKV